MNMHHTPRRTRTRHRLAAVALVLGGLVAAAPAVAHTDISSTAPGRGKVAPTSITRVVITFSGTIRRGAITVIGPGKRVVSVGVGGRDPRNAKRARVGLKTKLKAGQYTVTWRIVAADGHFQSGRYTFRLVRP